MITLAREQANLVAQMEEIEPFALAYTDFTEIPYPSGQRKPHFMPIIGHQCKVVYGWALSHSTNWDTALAAWQEAKATWQAEGIAVEVMVIHHDQDPVYTSYTWTHQLLQEDQARLSYALNCAKNNPALESFFDRFKREGYSRFLAAGDIEQLQEIFAERVDYYNDSRRHSSINYQTPMSLLRRMRLGCQGTNGAVDSVDNPDEVAHPARSSATTAVGHRFQESE